MTKEEILYCGVEGGGVAIYRTPAEHGGWLFHVEGTNMHLDEKDNEGWSSSRSDPVLSLEEALKSVAKDSSWVLYQGNRI